MATKIAKISATKEETAFQCATDIGPKCGKQVYYKLFNFNKTNMSKDCCYKLVQTGYPCHTRMTLHVLTDPEHKNANWTKVLAKSDMIFDKCDQVTKPASLIVLAKCIMKIGLHCGEEVHNNLIHDKSISEHCCGKLVEMGPHCHINIAKALIRTPEMRNANATQVMEKSKKIFHHCQHVK